jgi:hypothetical protein
MLVFKDRRVSKGPKVHRVFKVHKALRDNRVFRARKEHKELRVPKGFKVRKALRDNKVSREFK